MTTQALIQPAMASALDLAARVKPQVIIRSNRPLVRGMAAKPSKMDITILDEEARVKWSLGDFQQLEKLGQGFFGAVTLVQNTTSKRFYALKSIKKADIQRSKQIEHIKREKEILQRLSQEDNPFIVRLHGSFQDAASLYFVLEYLQGGELLTQIRNMNTIVNSREALNFYIAEIICALEYLHSKRSPVSILSPRQAHRVPGPQAREHHAGRRRPREADRLRPGTGTDPSRGLPHLH